MQLRQQDGSRGGRDGGGFMGLEKLEGLVSLRRGFYKGGQPFVSRRMTFVDWF